MVWIESIIIEKSIGGYFDFDAVYRSVYRSALRYEAHSASILPLNLLYEADSAAIPLLLYEADVADILQLILLYEADVAATMALFLQ